MDTHWHRNHTTLPTLDELTQSMQLGKAITKVNSTQSRPQWEDFRSEMMEETQGAYELGRLKTIWGMKFEFALRTAVAAFLASIYAMQPEVHKAEWENATVFAPVLAVACVSGPSLGATLHHAWEMWQATVIGCLSSMIVNEVLRPVQPNALREALMLVGFLSTVFFLCSRPWALVQKRVSVGVMLCGTINMSVHQHEKPWWFPWTIGVPCTVGVLCAVLAMVLPPWFACKELRQRLAFQALSERQVLVEHYTAFFSKSRTHHAAAAHRLETFRDNQLKMKSLLGPASWELILMPQTWTQLSLAVKFFDAQLLCLRRVQLTTSSVTQGLMSTSHMKFREATEESWKKSMKGLAGVVDDVVKAELSGRAISMDLLEHLKEGQKHLDRDIFRARAEIMYQSGSQFEEKEHQPVHHLQHVNRMACYFAVNELISATAKAATEAAHSERPSDPCSCWRKCLKWFELPPRHRAKNALKKVISLGLLCIGAWIPEWRAKRPEFIWAFIAASFIFSDLEGSSISTGLGRVIGTLFGGMVGFIVLEVFHFITWPWKELEIAAYILVCVSWTFGCSLSRSSPRHGYTATVAGFSIYIMVVGTLESFGTKASKDVTFQRMQEQFAGAVIYIMVEMLLWRKSARTQVNEQQITILKAIKDSIYEATAPHLSVVSEAPDSAPHTQKQMEAVYSKGNQALEAAKQGLVAATFEPTLWHKPFPMADFQRLLHTEEKALRLLHVLYAGTRAASPDSLDPDVPSLATGYCTAAMTSLEAAIGLLENHGKDWEVFNLTIDASEYLSMGGFHSSKDPEAGMETSGLDAALQLFAVQRADQKLREKLEHHFRRFREQEPNPNAASYSTNATMFCLLHLTGMMTELADRLRVASAAEQVVVHV
ncbi:unnamed protein product [Durusdinium trenchii]|uniref:Integral membrane bound transporter domain-containing protein n=1 Tax=Durusdinium trenchii TaxID=1381693 RepID=A0ABP0KEN5_9DINO